ncbi:MAG: CoA transferase [Rhodospirillales bacterium]|nr:CoA transferase [Rhodospirillales bacterium]
MSTPPLAGIRVLDLTSVVVGPSCTLRLADYGAEIIKLEGPEGDVLRTLGGPSPSGRNSGKYLHFNRNKRAICLDLKQAPARSALGRVIDRCDVVVSNIRPDSLARLGLDAASLRATRPGLVHCTITGFGPGGPYRGKPAYDTVIQSVAGVAGLAERRDGAPAFAPLLLCDHVVGEITAGAILAALFRRARSGEGAAIEVPMHETMAAFVLTEHLGPASFTPPRGRAGDSRVLDPNNRPIRTADGWMTVTANTDAQVAGFLRGIGRAELIADPRFRSVADRFRHASDWFALRRDALGDHPTAHWLAVFAAADVPAAICHTLESLPEDPHLAAVGLLVAETHPSEGEIRSIRPTVLEDGIAPPPGPPARAQGADTQAVLAEAGLDEAEIAALLASGAARGSV